VQCVSASRDDAIAPCERRDDRTVFGMGRLGAAAQRQQRGQQRHRRRELLQRTQEVAVVRGQVEHAVQPLVQRGERAGIAEQGRFVLDQLRHGGDLRLAGVLGGEAGGGALHDLPHYVELDHLAVVRPRHGEAAAGLVREQALGLQPAMACRTGVRDTPKRAASSVSVTRMPGGSDPSRRAARICP
jgi:hypothetical protein